MSDNVVSAECAISRNQTVPLYAFLNVTLGNKVLIYYIACIYFIDQTLRMNPWKRTQISMVTLLH